MAPQQDGLRKHGISSPWPQVDEEESDLPLSSSAFTGVGTDFAMETSTPPGYNAWKTWHLPYTDYPGYASAGGYPSYSRDGHPGSSATWSTRRTPDAEIRETSTSSTTPTLISSNIDPSLSATATDDPGSGRPGWPWAKKDTDNSPMYAAAAIVPILVLAIIGGVAFYCLRKRRRQRERATVTRMTAQEMKMQPRVTAHAYNAPPLPTVSPHYAGSASQPPPTSDPSAPPPVILGPISSGANGAYLTGIDTSDVISVTSNNLRPADPFADNSSLAEPPPPYRPRSIAPPSFVSASRQSSFRTVDAPPTTSQTHLIERSPFEDAQDDDVMSELSGPTPGRGDDDAISVVSDLSYQQDPVVGRSSLA
ncbi:uncharacterized protein K460DRAFT_357847 [Cucurbitaria berberidis CBS 394.84]|uniref:Uncharacterized protein n=1 Tax=Cucurbitaria berberidis CBS 394.84 TaxID=1168544 RepID=A0A9P4GE08_9PLEO|nr:uncharacterized protein K460DRAFT_357847 [Cucurbitaria berberidis CBS 394.84]KAF1844228.1 hypothetical protein K460DRAFT_357847 [Cucurbitaria berberidis CBS 394.84]